MRITQGYLDQLDEEIRRLARTARAAERMPGHDGEAARLRVELDAKQAKLARLRSERTEGVRFG